MARATPEAEQAVREYVDLWNERDASRLPEVVSESFVHKSPGAPGGEARGPEGVEEFMDEVTTAFPDFEVTIVEVIADDETAAVETEFTMTHEGEYDGLPPTGREIEIRGMSSIRVDDGELREIREYIDMQDFLEQLGVVGEEGGTATDEPSTGATERLAREHFDRVWNEGAFDADALADDYRVHLNLGGHETYTLEEYREFVRQSHEAIPDLRKEPEDVFATDDRVAIRYTMTGTQDGAFREIPATGEEIEIDAIDVLRIEDGEIAEEWIVADFLRALKQLGVVD